MKNQHTIEEIEKEIAEEFSLFDSWDDKYEYIIDLGKKLPPLEDQYKIDENRVRGCQSTVWLVADYRDGKIFYKVDLDSKTGEDREVWFTADGKIQTGI